MFYFPDNEAEDKKQTNLRADGTAAQDIAIFSIIAAYKPMLVYYASNNHEQDAEIVADDWYDKFTFLNPQENEIKIVSQPAGMTDNDKKGAILSIKLDRNKTTTVYGRKLMRCIFKGLARIAISTKPNAFIFTSGFVALLVAARDIKAGEKPTVAGYRRVNRGTLKSYTRIDELVTKYTSCCACCSRSSNSGSLAKCQAQNCRFYYCNRECQKKDWVQHKIICTKNQSEMTTIKSS